MPESDIHRPSNYTVGDKATFNTINYGAWIVDKSNPNRPLEVISKKSNEINFWDWEPNKLVKNYLMSQEEFDNGNYYFIIIK